MFLLLVAAPIMGYDTGVKATAVRRASRMLMAADHCVFL